MIPDCGSFLFVTQPDDRKAFYRWNRDLETGWTTHGVDLRSVYINSFQRPIWWKLHRYARDSPILEPQDHQMGYFAISVQS